jgi:large subunit ribosomal protein L4
MAQIPLRSLDGSDSGSIEVSDAVFAAKVNADLVHQAVVQQLANRRLGTHNSKTRGEVTGGGAKPWRQKSTGRARQGSRVSPLWRGGGVVFGPQPRTYEQNMPKKMRQSAIRSALTARLNEDAMFAIEAFSFDEPRTKLVAGAFKTLGLTGAVTVVDDGFEDVACRAARNLPDVELRDAASLNIIDVLTPKHIVFTRRAIESLQERLGAGR